MEYEESGDVFATELTIKWTFCDLVIKIHRYPSIVTSAHFSLRQDDFPTSVSGKGHDTGIVCRFLEHYLRSIDSRLSQATLESLPCSLGCRKPYWGSLSCRAQVCDTELLQLMRFTVWRANCLFDILYSYGVFIPPAASEVASKACMEFCETQQYDVWAILTIW